MNTPQLTDHSMRSPQPRRARRVRPSTRIVLRSATSRDAAALHSLIEAHVEEGRLLPRQLGELTLHADRFVVAVKSGRIVGCAELAPLSGAVAEVRSLVVHHGARGLGIGQSLVSELRRRARLAGFEQLCAFAHDAAYFARMGFSIVPHTWVPAKIGHDCTTCAQFRRCGQHAMVLSLIEAGRSRVHTYVPLATLRGRRANE